MHDVQEHASAWVATTVASDRRLGLVRPYEYQYPFITIIITIMTVRPPRTKLSVAFLVQG